MRLIDELNVQADGFIFDEKRGEMFTVNATGMLIIKAIQAEKSLKRISEEISRIYKVHLEQVEKDLFDFRSQMRQLRIG